MPSSTNGTAGQRPVQSACATCRRTPDARVDPAPSTRSSIAHEPAENDNPRRLLPWRPFSTEGGFSCRRPSPLRLPPATRHCDGTPTHPAPAAAPPSAAGPRRDRRTCTLTCVRTTAHTPHAHTNTPHAARAAQARACTRADALMHARTRTPRPRHGSAATLPREFNKHTPSRPARRPAAAHRAAAAQLRTPAAADRPLSLLYIHFVSPSPPPAATRCPARAPGDGPLHRVAERRRRIVHATEAVRGAVRGDGRNSGGGYNLRGRGRRALRRARRRRERGAGTTAGGAEGRGGSGEQMERIRYENGEDEAETARQARRDTANTCGTATKLAARRTYTGRPTERTALLVGLERTGVTAPTSFWACPTGCSVENVCPS